MVLKTLDPNNKIPPPAPITDSSDVFESKSQYSQGKENDWKEVKNKKPSINPYAIRNENKVIPSKNILPNKVLFCQDNSISELPEKFLAYSIILKIAPTNKNKPFSVCKAKCLTALLTLLQTVEPVSGISPASGITSDEYKNIYDVEKIPFEPRIIDKYFINPAHNSYNNTFTAGFNIQSLKYLHEIKSNSIVKEYLMSENIIIELNTLTTTHPHRVGILLNVFPRWDLELVHNIRFSEMLPPGQPFQATCFSIRSDEIRTRVYLILADEKDKANVHNRFNTCTTDMFKYVSWDQYNSAPQQLQKHWIRTQVNFAKENNIAKIDGFQPECKSETIPMWATDDEDPSVQGDFTVEELMVDGIDRTTTSVSDFIHQYYRHGDGTPLFKYVYPSRLGVIEGIISKEHYNEAKRCTPFIKTDLYSFMNTHTAEHIFSDIETIREKYMANNCERWSPLQYNENPESYEYENEDERTSKRSRNGKKLNSIPNSYGHHQVSYAQKAMNYEEVQVHTNAISCNSTITSNTIGTNNTFGNRNDEQLSQITESIKEFEKMSISLKKQMEDLKLQQNLEKVNREKDIREMKHTFEENLNGLSNAFANRFETSDERLENNFKNLNDTIKSMVMLQGLAREKRMLAKQDEEIIRFYEEQEQCEKESDYDKHFRNKDGLDMDESS